MTQIPPTQTFAVADPRTFDGNPYEVAARACAQAAAVARILKQVTETATLMARNAELERQLVVDGNCDVAAWDASIHKRKLDATAKAAADAERDLTLVGRAAGFDPKAR